MTDYFRQIYFIADGDEEFYDDVQGLQGRKFRRRKKSILLSLCNITETAVKCLSKVISRSLRLVIKLASKFWLENYNWRKIHKLNRKRVGYISYILYELQVIMHPFGVVDLHKSHNLYTRVSFLRTREDILGNRFFWGNSNLCTCSRLLINY